MAGGLHSGGGRVFGMQNAFHRALRPIYKREIAQNAVKEGGK